MKKLMGIETNDSSKMQGLANKVADGNCEMLANSMNDSFLSVSEHLPRLNVDNEVFAVEGELPAECIAGIQTKYYDEQGIRAWQHPCLGFERPCRHTGSSADCYF